MEKVTMPGKSTLRCIMLVVVVPLTAAAVFYLCFCPDVYFVKIVRSLFSVNLSAPDSIFFQLPLWRLLRNYFADFCWAKAFSGLILLTGMKCELNMRKCTVLCVTLSLTAELIQLFDFVPLTFDTADILVQEFGTAAAVLNINKLL